MLSFAKHVVVWLYPPGDGADASSLAQASRCAENGDAPTRLGVFAWDVEQFDRVPSVAKKMLVVDRLQLRGGKETCSVVLPLSVLAKTFLMVMSS